MAVVTTLYFALLGTSLALPSSLQARDRPSTQYLLLGCTKEIEDSSVNDSTRWTAAQATQAMIDWDWQWTNNRDAVDGTDKTLGYSNAMFRSFGYDDQHCGLTTDSCDFSTRQCNEFKCPAHYLIAHSLSNLHSFWETYYFALDQAKNSVSGKMASFVSIFAPQKPDPDLISVMISNFQGFAFDMLLEATMGPLGKVLSNQVGEEAADKIASAGKNLLNAAKEKAMESGAIGVELSAEEKRATLTDTLHDIVDRYAKAVDTYLNDILVGEMITSTVLGMTFSFSKLTLEFFNGAWLSYGGFNADMFQIEQNLQKAFSALLIPSAWRLADGETYGTPIILVKNTPCQQGSPSFCFSDDAIAGGSCVVEGKTLYLVGYTGARSRDAMGHPIFGCPHNTFVKLPGMDNLNNAKAPDLTKDVLIRSVWDAYVAAGSKNGYGAELSIDGAGGSIVKPGLLQIPICDFDEAIKIHTNDAGTRLCDYGW